MVHVMPSPPSDKSVLSLYQKLADSDEYQPYSPYRDRMDAGMSAAIPKVVERLRIIKTSKVSKANILPRDESGDGGRS